MADLLEGVTCTRAPAMPIPFLVCTLPDTIRSCEKLVSEKAVSNITVTNKVLVDNFIDSGVLQNVGQH
jgi:hypothetical protein